MGLFSNPLGHAGYPADPTTAQVVNSTVRAATTAEAAAGVLKNVYISPATLAAGNTADFASPPPIGATTPNTGAFTTLTGTVVTGSTSVNTPSLVATAATITTETTTTSNITTANIATAVITTATVTSGTITTLSAPTLTTTTPSVAGASPVVNNSRAGQASYTDVIANGAYGTLVMTNSSVVAASVILASASCVTVDSAVQIVEITPGVGTVSFRLLNAGSASTAANILINYWVMS